MVSIQAHSAASPEIDVVLDAALLGVSAVYPSQRAGIWRFTREWARELASRDGVRLHLVSGGRAPWNELALEQVRLEDPFLATLPHQWHPRASRLPGARSFQSRLGAFVFRLARTGAISPTVCAGVLKSLQIGLEPTICPVAGAVYHSPYHALPESVVQGGCQVRSLTVHDMIPVLFPRWFGDTSPFRAALGSIGKSDRVFADSESTRSDLIRIQGCDPASVHVAYPGISPIFVERDRSSCRGELGRLGIPDVRYLLAVGTLEPRKNLSVLLEAFGLLAATPGCDDVRLVLTGARGWKNEVFDRVLGGLGAARDRVILTGYIDDTDLPILYGACEAFVYPSLYEGFGLPIAEAMASGAAVVCGDNSSQPEVAGDVAEAVDATDAGALANALTVLLGDSGRLQSMRSRGPARAKAFTWTKCVDAYLDGWRDGTAGGVR